MSGSRTAGLVWSRVTSGMRRGMLAGAVVAMALLAGADAGAQPVAVTAGVSVRALSGTFGSEQTTTVVYIPASLRIDVDRLETSFFFPYVSIIDGTVALSQGGFVPMQGSLTAAPGVGMPMGARGSGMMGGGMMGGNAGPPGAGPALDATTGVPASSLTNQSGLGDIVGTVGYRVVDRARARVQVVVGARVKIPTASAVRGLGTGKTDFGALAGVRKQFDQGWLYAEGGYLKVGRPAGVDLRNAAFWSIGTGRRLSGRTSLLASAAGSTPIVREFGAPVEVGAGLGLRAGDRLVLTILPSVGLTDASPRVALTFSLSRRVLER